jgi:hypothetical protein
VADLRTRLGWFLRRTADRIDPSSAPRAVGYSFTFELYEGIRFRTDGRGCPLWHLGEADHDRAHEEADTRAPWIDWKTGTLQ